MELDKDYNLTVGLRIREVREVLNMTREEFSEKCDISSSFLAAVENGKKAVTSKTLYKICTVFNISADYIIRGNKDTFETDMILEMLNSMDAKAREHALRILREYIEAIHTFSQ
ncbi:helix-turn-helix domain-containing protein [Ruminococcus sp. 5_1_39BFAA]|uniref:helix-turn-helix domain-containing protein n=1 Tax=Ruminococcus sp. 5_1_39BFAA TaxID=457412 RepID=UPI0035658470